MKKRIILPLLGAAIVLPTAALRAAVAGFSAFAPVNATNSDAGAVSTDPNIGYQSGGTTFVLTDGASQEGTSGYAAIPQNISGSWTASFSYQSIPQVYSGSTSGGNASYVAADGFAMVFQNDLRGAAALGGDGGAYGYGAAPSANTNPLISTVTPSAAITVNNFGGFLNYQGAVGFNTNGSTNTPSTLGTVSISSGLTGSNQIPHTINVTYSYSAATGQLKEMFVDPAASHGTSSQSVYVHVDNGVNLASIVGGPTAYIGFAGGTGGFVSSQTISNFSFTSASQAAAVTVPSTTVFTPIALSAGSFNQALVVPASASGMGAGTANPVAKFVTATMDNGASFTVSSSGDTWFEQGFVAGGGSTPSNAAAGLPTSGSTFTSVSDTRHKFTMPVFGLTTAGTPLNDAVLLDDGDSGAVGDKSATMTFAEPKAYSALSFLTATGNGPGLFSVTVHYANGSIAVLPGDLVSPDWFGSGTLAYSTGGRYEIDNNGYDIHSNGQPNLWQVDVGLSDIIDPISSVTLTYDGGDRGEVAIFAVSGATVPEPASMSLLALGATGLLRRRRSSRM